MMRFRALLAFILTFAFALALGQDNDGQRYRKLTPGPKYERLDKSDAVCYTYTFPCVETLQRD